MSWNGFPKYVRKSLLNRLCRNNGNRTPVNEDADVPKIWLSLPYAGLKGETLVKSLIRKLRRYLKDVKIIVRQNNKKLSFFCSTKDPIPTEQRS